MKPLLHRGVEGVHVDVGDDSHAVRELPAVLGITVIEGCLPPGFYRRSMFKGRPFMLPAQAGGVDGGGRGVPWDSRRAGYFTACDNPMHQPARWSATSAEQLPQRGRRGRSRLVVSARARAAPRPLRTPAAAGSQPLQGTVHAGSPTGGTPTPDNVGYCHIYRPLHFVSGREHTYESFSRRLPNRVTAGLLDRAALDPAQLHQVDSGKVLWLGPFQVATDHPAKQFVRKLVERSNAWLLPSQLQ